MSRRCPIAAATCPIQACTFGEGHRCPCSFLCPKPKHPRPSLLRRIAAFFLDICPRCSQTTYDPVSRLHFFYCQTPGCHESTHPVYGGPERRA